MIVYGGANLTSVKILLILAALFLVNPVGTHLIGKAAIRAGKTPWKEEKNHADLSA
jgi:multisubunit Na+/H+ antiporter MnhG subunit